MQEPFILIDIGDLESENYKYPKYNNPLRKTKHEGMTLESMYILGIRGKPKSYIGARH